MDDPKLPSHESSIPLIARLDHLEFIMKYLERKQRCGSNNNVPAADKQSSDSAMKEAYFKGTLLDRVASLEHRLFQLCVEMDSSGSSHPLSRASTQTSGESSSSQGTKGEICYSFPTFNNLPNHRQKEMPQNHNKTLELEYNECEESWALNLCALKARIQYKTEKSESVQHQTKNSCPPKQQMVVKNRPKKDEKKLCKGGKKQMPPIISWPHLKLLGC